MVVAEQTYLRITCRIFLTDLTGVVCRAVLADDDLYGQMAPLPENGVECAGNGLLLIICRYNDRYHSLLFSALVEAWEPVASAGTVLSDCWTADGTRHTSGYSRDREAGRAPDGAVLLCVCPDNDVNGSEG